MGNKRTFGICNATCSSSASVGENLCGVLELAKGVGTIEKLWCVWLCSSRGAPSLPIVQAFPHDILRCRWIKRVWGSRYMLQNLFHLERLPSNYTFRLFGFTAFCSVVTQKQWEVPFPGVFCSHLPHIENGKLNVWASCVFVMVCNGSVLNRCIWFALNLWHKLGQNPKLSLKMPKCIKKKMLFLPASYSLQTDRHLI